MAERSNGFIFPFAGPAEQYPQRQSIQHSPTLSAKTNWTVADDQMSMASYALAPTGKEPEVEIREIEAPFLSPLRKKLCIVALCLWNLMVSIDATSTSIALPSIAEDLHADDTTIYWVGTSFVLCSAVLQPLYAGLTPALGRIRILVVALVLFLVGVIICGAAKDPIVLIVGRCIQGAGAGGLLTLTYVVLAVYFDMAERAKLYGFLGLAWLVGATTGPLIGGAFAEAGAWRWIFWFNIPLAVICFPSVFFLKEDKMTWAQMKIGLARIDWFGAVFFAAALTTFLVPLSWGGTNYPWKSYQTLVPLVLGFTALVAWACYSYIISSNPLIPRIVISDSTTLISYFTTILHGILFFGIMYFLPLFSQGVKGYDSIMSGVSLLPQCLFAGVSALTTAVLLKKFSLVKPFTLGGWIIMTIGLLYFQLMSPQTTYAEWILLNISGTGLGILFSALSTATQAAAEKRAAEDASKTRVDVGKVRVMAAGLNPFFRAVGQSFGIVIGQAVVGNELSKKTDGQFTGDGLKSVAYIQSLPDGDPRKEAMVTAFTESLRVFWWILLGVAALGAVLTFFTRESGLGGVEEERGVIEMTDRSGEA